MKDNAVFSFKRALGGLFLLPMSAVFVLYIYNNSFDYTGMDAGAIAEIKDSITVFFTITLCVCGALGFILNGLRVIREKFSLITSLIGVIIGDLTAFLFVVVFKGLLEDIGGANAKYYLYYIFMALGFFLFGFLMRDWIPSFAKTEKGDKFGDLWKM